MEQNSSSSCFYFDQDSSSSLSRHTSSRGTKCRAVAVGDGRWRESEYAQKSIKIGIKHLAKPFVSINLERGSDKPNW